MTTSADDTLFEAEGYALMGAAFEVYNHLGPGFLEEVYQEAMEIELTARGIPFVPKPRLHVFFKEQQLKKNYEADLLVHSAIVVELKAARAPSRPTTRRSSSTNSAPSVIASATSSISVPPHVSSGPAACSEFPPFPSISVY